jgi:hypothetical protein
MHRWASHTWPARPCGSRPDLGCPAEQPARLSRRLVDAGLKCLSFARYRRRSTLNVKFVNFFVRKRNQKVYTSWCRSHVQRFS